MKIIFFNFYGFILKIEISHFQSEILNALEQFNFFSASVDVQPFNCCIKINSATEINIKAPGIKIFTTKMCEVRQLSFRKRLMLYKIGNNLVASATDTAKSDYRTIQIEGKDGLLVAEILYYVIMSVTGEYLDKIGFMRLHAASISVAELGKIIWARPGGGKSTIVSNLISSPRIRIFSDELSLVDLSSQKIKPFPLHISLLEKNEKPTDLKRFFNLKNKTPVPKEKISHDVPLSHFFVLKRGEENKTLELSLGNKIYLYFEIILGLGLIQMTEYFIRFDNIFGLFRIFLNRLLLLKLLNKLALQTIQRNDNEHASLQFIKSNLDRT